MTPGKVFCFENEDKIHGVQVPEIQSKNCEKGRLLISYPAQSNFDGFRCSSPVEKIQKYLPSTSTYVLLDIASLVSSSTIPFSSRQIDFAPFSFYKLFGHPTSLGGLIIRKTLLKPPQDFFGGGSVKAWLPTEKIAFEKDDVESWSLGSPPSSEMLSALIGLNTWLELTNGLINLSSFLLNLCKTTLTALNKITYSNGAPAFEIYNRGNENSSGPIITFNVKKANGIFFRPGDISRLMASEGFILRSGCMCNLEKG
jgi:molybdenum cofactor sulfurtransferase